jgi:hypothetical protein
VPELRSIVPIQVKLNELFGGFMDYSYQFGSLHAANISDQTLEVAKAMKRLGQMEKLDVPRSIVRQRMLTRCCALRRHPTAASP